MQRFGLAMIRICNGVEFEARTNSGTEDDQASPMVLDELAHSD